MMNPLLFLEKVVMHWLVSDYRHRTLKQAVTRSGKAFTQQYPQWEKALFDEHFLAHRGLRVLEASVKGFAPDPVVLAQAWADQWGFEARSRARRVAELAPVAAEFLSLLETELRGVWAPGSLTPSGVTGLAGG